jgi:hypothetical protein
MCRTAVLLVLLMLPAVSAGAQWLPTAPVDAFDGRLVVGAEAVVTLGAEDDSAFFNYTDYEHNTLRMFRLGLTASWRPVSRIAVVGEIRSENLDLIRPYAAYVRVRPFNGHAFDVQIGRIPPSFGAFGRRGYNADQPFIGYPLAYQYLTSLRPDAVPANVGDLLVMRGRGWLASYPVGSPQAAPGVPLISAFRWDTGIQAHWAGRIVDVTGSVTSGTLSDPRANDNNGGKQLSGRVAVRPAVGLVLGASAARGEFLSQNVANLLADTTSSHAQTAFGADVEYSRDYWIVRSELVWSRWNTPFAATGTSADLDSLGVWVEGRYRVTPRISVAGRLDRLGFAKIAAAPGVLVAWDAPVTRVEGDVCYYFRRNLVARLAVQYNDREGGRVHTRTFVSGQVAFWF